MQRHYNKQHAKHKEERFPCRSAGCEKNYSEDGHCIDHERKIHELCHSHGTKSDPCRQSIEGAQSWKMHQKKLRPHPCTEPDGDKGYASLRSLREHRQTAHTSNNQSRSNPQSPSKLIPVVPQPEPVFNEGTKQPIPNGKKWWRFFGKKKKVKLHTN